MDIRHIQFAVVLAECRSFTRAAEVLSISQPVLSNAIKKVESYYGTSLFSRGGRSTSLTPAGELFIKEAKGILSKHDLIKKEIRFLLKPDIGDISVSIDHSVPLSLITNIIRSYKEKHPGVNISIHRGTFARFNQGLLDGKISIHLGDYSDTNNDDRWKISKLSSHPLSFFCAANHPLAQNEDVEFKELSAYPLAVTDASKSLTKIFTSKLKHHDIHCNVTFCNDDCIVKSLASTGEYIGVADFSDTSNNEFIEIDTASTFYTYLVGVIQLKNRWTSTAVKSFIQICKDQSS